MSGSGRYRRLTALLLGMGLAGGVVASCGEGETATRSSGAGGATSGPPPAEAEAAAEASAGGAEGDAQGAADVPVLQFATDGDVTVEGFELEWAFWGDRACAIGFDATELTRRIIQERGRLMWTPEYSAGVGDPLPGKMKWLTAVVRTPAGPIRVGLEDRSSLCFTTPSNWLWPWASKQEWPQHEIERANALLASGPREDMGLVWARWGNDGSRGGWVEANIAIDAQFAGDGRIFNKTRDMAVLESPNSYPHKSLRVLLAIGGQPVGSHLRGDSYIATAPSEAELLQPAPEPAGAAAEGEQGSGASDLLTPVLEDVQTVTAAVASADGRWLYVLDAPGGRLLRLDTSSMELAGEISGIDSFYKAMALSPDGRTLYLGGPTDGFDGRRQRPEASGMLAAVNTITFKMARMPRSLRCDISRLVVTASGKLIAVNAAGGHLEEIDAISGVMTGERPGRPYLRMHPDGELLLTTDHNGIEGIMVGAGLSREPGAQATEVGGAGRVRGQFTMIDGSHLLTVEGSLVRVARNIHHMFLGVKQLPPNGGAVVSHGLGVLVLAIQNGVQLWSWPQLEPISQERIEGVLVDLSLAADGQTVLATWLPQGKLDYYRAPSERAGAALVQFDLGAILPEEHAPQPALRDPQDVADGPITRRLPLGTDITALVTPASGASLYALDAAAGVVHRLDPQSLEILATSDQLPFSTNRLAIDRDGRWLAAAATPAPWRSNKEKEGGTITVLDPQTLKVRRSISTPIDPREIAIGPHRQLYVAGGSNQSTAIIEYDIGRGIEVSRHQGVRQGSDLSLSPSGSVLYLSTRGVSPGSVSGLRLSGPIADAEPIRFWPADQQAGGRLWLGVDGEYLITSAGGVIRPPRPGAASDTFTGLGSVNTVSAAALDERRLIACDTDNRLNIYSLPALALERQIPLDGAITELCLDHRSGRLYGVLREGGVFEGHERFSGPVLGDIVLFDLSQPSGGAPGP